MKNAFHRLVGPAALAARPATSARGLTWTLVVALAVATSLSSVACAQEHPETAPTTTSAAGHGEAGHGDAGHETGLPGLVPEVDLALWSIITFGLFVFLLGRYAWGPLATELRAREGRIHGDLTRAEENRLKSEQLLRDYEQRLAKVQEEVTGILAEARRDAAALRQTMLTSTQQEVEATKKRALADIERARDQALTEVFDSVVTNVFKATEQLVGRSVRDDDNDRFVRTAIEQIGAGNN